MSACKDILNNKLRRTLRIMDKNVIKSYHISELEWVNTKENCECAICNRKISKGELAVHTNIKENGEDVVKYACINCGDTALDKIAKKSKKEQEELSLAPC